MDVDDDMEPAPENINLVDTTASDTLFEGQTLGWDEIDNRAVVAQNQNNPSFKNGCSPQRISYIDIILHFIPIKRLRSVLIPSTSRSMKEAGIDLLTLVYLLRYLGLWILMSTCSGWKRDNFWSVTHRCELPGNYPVFTVVMVIYTFVRRISIITLPSNCF